MRIKILKRKGTQREAQRGAEDLILYVTLRKPLRTFALKKGYRDSPSIFDSC